MLSPHVHSGHQSNYQLNDAIAAVVDSAQRVANAERSTLFIVDENRGELVSRVAKDVDEIRIPITKGIAGFVASSGETVHIPDAYGDLRFDFFTDIKT